MTLFIRPAAQADLIEIGDYIAIDNPDRALSCVSAWNIGSDSHLMISRWKLMRLSERNQHHGDQVSSVVPDPGRIDC